MAVQPPDAEASRGSCMRINREPHGLTPGDAVWLYGLRGEAAKRHNFLPGVVLGRSPPLGHGGAVDSPAADVRVRLRGGATLEVPRASLLCADRPSDRERMRAALALERLLPLAAAAPWLRESFAGHEELCLAVAAFFRPPQAIYHFSGFANKRVEPEGWCARKRPSPWQPTAAALRPRIDCAAVSCDEGGDRVLLAGGCDDHPTRVRTFFDDACVYDSLRDEWTPLPPMRTRRHGCSGALLDGTVYIVGGNYVEQRPGERHSVEATGGAGGRGQAGGDGGSGVGASCLDGPSFAEGFDWISRAWAPVPMPATRKGPPPVAFAAVGALSGRLVVTCCSRGPDDPWALRVFWPRRPDLGWIGARADELVEEDSFSPAESDVWGEDSGSDDAPLSCDGTHTAAAASSGPPASGRAVPPRSATHMLRPQAVQPTPFAPMRRCCASAVIGSHLVVASGRGCPPRSVEAFAFDWHIDSSFSSLALVHRDSGRRQDAASLSDDELCRTLAAGRWARLPDLVGARVGGRLVVVAGALYATGGIDEQTGAFSATAERFEGASEGAPTSTILLSRGAPPWPEGLPGEGSCWRLCPDLCMPKALHAHSAVALVAPPFMYDVQTTPAFECEGAIEEIIAPGLLEGDRLRRCGVM